MRIGQDEPAVGNAWRRSHGRAALAIIGIVAAIAAVAACGGSAVGPAGPPNESVASPSARRPDEAGTNRGKSTADEAERAGPEARSTGASVAESPRNASGYTMLVPEAAPPRLRALFARFELSYRESLPVPANICQDVLLLIERGRIELTSPGAIVPRGEMGAGESARVGPRSATIRGLSPTTGYAVFARATGHEIDSSRPEEAMLPPESADCEGQRGDTYAGWSSGGRLIDEPLVAAGGKLEVRILVDRPNQGASFGALSVLDGVANVGVPEHVHEASAELLLIRSGSGKMKLGDTEVTVAPGQIIYVPEGTLHDFRSDGAAPLEAIQVYSPPGPEQRFRGGPESGAPDGGVPDGGVRDGGAPRSAARNE